MYEGVLDVLMSPNWQDFYPTPLSCLSHPELLKTMQMAKHVLEPTAGLGSMLYSLYDDFDWSGSGAEKVEANEINKEFADFLKWNYPNVNVTNNNFLERKIEKNNYDLILMNPPFTDGRKDKHYYLNFLFKALAMMEKYNSSDKRPDMIMIAPEIWTEKHKNGEQIINLEDMRGITKKKKDDLMKQYNDDTDQDYDDWDDLIADLPIFQVMPIGMCKFQTTTVQAYVYLIKGLYTPLEMAGEGLSDVIGRIKQLLGRRREFTPSSRKVLDKYGRGEYARVMVCRKPLDENLLGFIKKIKNNVPYDKLYHLSIRFELPGGKWLRLDKREDLQASIETSIPAKTECIAVNIGNKTPDNVNDILEMTRKAVGDSQFYDYKATTNNCQRFIMDILQSSGMQITPQIAEFVLQDVGDLVPEWIASLSNVATDVKAKINQLLQGKGYDSDSDSDDEMCSGAAMSYYYNTNPSNQKVYWGALTMQNNAYTQSLNDRGLKMKEKSRRRRARAGITAGGFLYNQNGGYAQGHGFSGIRGKVNQDYYAKSPIGVAMRPLNTFN
jgi:predicted RNA methylase